MAEFKSWEDYVYPPPDEDTLRNRFGIRDFWELRDLEYSLAARAETQIRAGVVEIPRTFDEAHVRAIHRELFGALYPWAGELRQINMRKPGNAAGFAGVRNGAIHGYLKGVNELVTTADWSRMTHEQFAESAAQVFAWLNQAHPFREGNGRSSRIFMDHVAELSPFELDRGRVARQEWDRASAASSPDSHTSTPKWQALVGVFSRMAITRPTETSLEAAAALTSVLQASYPRAAADALMARRQASLAGSPKAAKGKEYGAGIGD